MFYSILDTVILNISTRFEAAKNIVDIFSVLWRFLSLEDIEIEEQANCLQNHYVAINSQFKEEIKHLKSIFSANFLDTEVAPLSLLNKIHKLKLDSLSALRQHYFVSTRTVLYSSCNSSSSRTIF